MKIVIRFSTTYLCKKMFSFITQNVLAPIWNRSQSCINFITIENPQIYIQKTGANVTPEIFNK